MYAVVRSDLKEGMAGILSRFYRKNVAGELYTKKGHLNCY